MKKIVSILTLATVVTFIASSILIAKDKDKDKDKGKAPDTALAAKVGDRKITTAELDEASKADLGPLSAQIYQIKRNRLDQMVQEALYDQESKKQKKSVDEIKKDANKIDATMSDDAIEVYFDSNQAKYQGKTLDQVKEEIRQTLIRQKTGKAQSQFLVELKKRYPTEIYLEEPKVVLKTEGAPSRGPANAKVTIVEFSEFQCPFCKKFQPTIDQIVKEYPNDVRHVFYNLPLPFHNNARGAARAGVCADKQGKFWEFREMAFVNQQAIDEPNLRTNAEKLGLDMAKFDVCVKDPATDKKIEEDLAYAASVGARGTPTSFVNGVLFSGARPYEELKKTVDQKLGKS